MSRRAAPAGTQSVLRAVHLLKALSKHDGLDLAALTREVGLARTTTHRLLAALKSEDLVAQEAGGDYRLGPGAVALGNQRRRSSQLRVLAHPHLRKLAAESGETATLEVQFDAGVLIVDEVLGRHLVGVNREVGTSWPIHATSTGKALLASMGRDDRAALLVGRLSRLTTRTVTSKRQLEAQLKQTAQRGYATAEGELADGFNAVAAAVVNADGHPLAAISVGGPDGRLTGRELSRVGGAVRETAALLSETLSYA